MNWSWTKNRISKWQQEKKKQRVSICNENEVNMHLEISKVAQEIVFIASLTICVIVSCAVMMMMITGSAVCETVNFTFNLFSILRF